MDFEEFADNKTLPADGLKRLQELIDEADMLDAQIDELSEQLKSLNTRYNFIRLTELPTLMTELQTGEWKNDKGTKVEVENFLSGGLPKEPAKHNAAIQWVGENGGEPLIKGILEVEFSKSQHNEALALLDDLRKSGHNARYEPSIHPQTLLAFVREKLKKGEDIDLPLLGIYSGRTAKITHAGKAKPTKPKKPKKGDLNNG